MALIECPECGHRISSCTDFSARPSCGFPLQGCPSCHGTGKLVLPDLLRKE
jgi:hypothetical protein